MNVRLLLGPGLLFLATASPAQNFLGLSTNPRSGTHRTYINPALSADSPHKFDLNIAAANIHVNNNFVRYQAPYSILTLLTNNVPDQYKRSDGSLDFKPSYTKEILDGQPKNVTVWGELRGPALRLPVGGDASLTLSTRLRGTAQVLGASEDLLSAIRASLADNALYSIPNQNNRFNIGANVYSEYALTYAKPIAETDAVRVLAGATLKYLRGFTAGYLVNDQLNYSLQSEPTPPNNPYLQVSQINARMAFTNYLQNKRLTMSTFFSGNVPGKGVGADFGIAIMNQVEDDQPVWQLSLSLTDVGTIFYNGESYDVNEQNVKFTPGDFNNVNITSPEQVANVVREKLNLSPATSLGRFRMTLPTALNLTADLQATDKFGIGFVWRQNVLSSQAAAVRQPTLISVVPRYDTKLITLAAPVTYLNQSILIGLSARVGPFWLGSDNIFGLIGNGNNGIHPRGTDLYAGVCFGF